MSSKTLEGMALRYKAEFARIILNDPAIYKASEIAMKAALLWLADNVSDEMVEAYLAAKNDDHYTTVRDGISAALRAAAGVNERGDA